LAFISQVATPWPTYHSAQVATRPGLAHPTLLLPQAETAPPPDRCHHRRAAIHLPHIKLCRLPFSSSKMDDVRLVPSSLNLPKLAPLKGHSPPAHRRVTLTPRVTPEPYKMAPHLGYNTSTQPPWLLLTPSTPPSSSKLHHNSTSPSSRLRHPRALHCPQTSSPSTSTPPWLLPVRKWPLKPHFSQHQ
jgi:hypothetical protein